MKIPLIPIFLAMVMSAPGPGAAQQALPEGCSDAQTQTELNFCSFKAYEKADKDVKAALQKALATVKDWSPESAKKLQDAQKSWIAYRERACDIYEYPGNGTIAPLLMNECLLKITQDRTADLETLAAGLGN